MKRAAVLLTIGLLSGCDDMIVQSNAKLYDPEAGRVHPAEETVPWQDAPEAPPPLTLALIERGQQRFRIDCTPCHGELGDGQGMIVQRGFSPPPSYHIARLREAPTRHFYDVITHGYGAMYSFADRVAPRDRWAIAAYIRALQRSQDVPTAELTAEQKQALK